MIRVLDRAIYCPTIPSALTLAFADYSAAAGQDMVRLTMRLTRSDTIDQAEVAVSSDNGLTWEPSALLRTREVQPGGILRRHPRSGVVDPVRDLYIGFHVEGILPTDDPLEGMKRWCLWYTVSRDGGRTLLVKEQVIQEGPYSPEHPLDGVWIGRNGAQIGDMASRPIRIRSGEILVPFQFSPLDASGQYQNPGGGYTYHHAAVLIGTWTAESRLTWRRSDPIEPDPQQSTRGCFEPTLAEFPGGRILMVLRGSNDANPRLPGYKWCTLSGDAGRTWSRLRPWTYDDGESFFSPSSCSQLLNHSNGRCYWLGNIAAHNPSGNLPRYPMVMGEVDLESGQLRRDTVVVIDDRRPQDSARLTLSNFQAHEDRASGQVWLHMSRPFAHGERDWTSDAYLYRIEV